MDGCPRTKFDFEWWELSIAEEFLELPFVQHMNELEEIRELSLMEGFMMLPFYDANDMEMLDIPSENWEDDDNLEEEMRLMLVSCSV